MFRSSSCVEYEKRVQCRGLFFVVASSSQSSLKLRAAVGVERKLGLRGTVFARTKALHKGVWNGKRRLSEAVAKTMGICCARDLHENALNRAKPLGSFFEDNGLTKYASLCYLN